MTREFLDAFVDLCAIAAFSAFVLTVAGVLTGAI